MKRAQKALQGLVWGQLLPQLLAPHSNLPKPLAASPTQTLWLPHLVCTLTSGFYFPLPILLTSPTSTGPDWSFLLPTASPPIDYFPFISSGRFCQPGLQGGQALFKSQSTMSWSHHFPSLSFPVAQQGNNGIYLAGLSGGLHAHCTQRISAQMPSVVPDLRALHYRASTPSFLIVPK